MRSAVSKEELDSEEELNRDLPVEKVEDTVGFKEERVPFPRGCLYYWSE